MQDRKKNADQNRQDGNRNGASEQLPQSPWDKGKYKCIRQQCFHIPHDDPFFVSGPIRVI